MPLKAKSEQALDITQKDFFFYNWVEIKISDLFFCTVYEYEIL